MLYINFDHDHNQMSNVDSSSVMLFTSLSSGEFLTIAHIKGSLWRVIRTVASANSISWRTPHSMILKLQLSMKMSDLFNRTVA